MANEVMKKENSMCERFVKAVSAAGTSPDLSDYQRSLIGGYFFCCERAMQAAEEERLRKNAVNRDEKYNNNLPCVWKNINIEDLTKDLYHYAKMGLDMLQDNMLFAIPFQNKKTGKYDLNLMEGYNGIRYMGERYAIDKPKAVTVEVVYSTDKFKPIKKSFSNETESYEFEITNPFDRGKIIGGFAYIEFEESRKNELIIMSMKDIEKRKPKYASANFWGGTQTVWESGKKVEKQTDGWLDEMVRKTLIREAYSAKHLPRDPKKMDDSYTYVRMREVQAVEAEAQEEISENANREIIDLDVVEEEPVKAKETADVESPEPPVNAEVPEMPEIDF